MLNKYSHVWLSLPDRRVEILKVEQPTWEGRERGHGQHIVLELLDKHGLHNRCLLWDRAGW